MLIDFTTLHYDRFRCTLPADVKSLHEMLHRLTHSDLHSQLSFMRDMTLRRLQYVLARDSKMKIVAKIFKVRRAKEMSLYRTQPLARLAKARFLRAFAADGMRTTLDGNLSDSQLENKL
jgi:hypothetical protein